MYLHIALSPEQIGLKPVTNHISDDIRAGGLHARWPTEDDATADADRGFIGTIDPP